MGQNILFQYLTWHYVDQVRGILLAWKNFLRFNLNYFSISLLLKTLFSHWRKYQWSYGRGFDIKRYAEVFFSNLISRVIGAIIRFFLILIGVVAEIIIVLAGIIVFLGWLLLPVLLLAGLWFGFKLLF
ncbi:MAG: hypothetical protein COY73_01130 [Candidatus Nealsonbacteria bacterium CG_4_10_14_0_8_um_filter_37_14]|uniref:Uncharacterized protein n=1 Tax=Candidatus Nealsonbacteria bacterium CG_4_10_14_0_8_um_filter_37_14 TaxID=1974684 RepID=A0A2M7R6R8_9BACT|nr:MAG: hypothetical protein COY73_01130 [Candidatus Nealsonbacteria bacterium CG_4_10_14_0_8_um_filter_37_14]